MLLFCFSSWNIKEKYYLLFLSINLINNAGELDVLVVSAGSKSKSACLVLDGDTNSDGSENLAVNILWNGFETRSKTRQNEDSLSTTIFESLLDKNLPIPMVYISHRKQ